MVGLTPEDRLARKGQDPHQNPPKANKPKAPGHKPHWALRLIGRLFGLALGIGLMAAIVGGFVAWRIYERYSIDLPSLDTLRNYQPAVMSRVYAGNSQLVSELASERRIYVPLSAIPPMVQQAFISAEDQNFWTNPGIDPEAMARAAITDILQYGKGRRPIGASTITQQVARNILLDDAPTISRKVRELIIATRVEQSMSKQHILELYLNEINLGLSSYGVAAAAQSYFNKSLDDLTLPEAAFLAVLPKAPAHYNPFRFPEAAKARRDWVLDRMANDHAITQAQADAAKATPIDAAPFRRPDEVVGGEWFAEEVRRELVDTYGNDVLTGGYIIRTSLDPQLQAAADIALRNGLMAYDRKYGGWRGAVSHIDTGPLLANNWISSLSAVPKPAAMLNNWVMAVVLHESATSATLGYLYVPPGALPSDAIAQTLPMNLADVKWARRAGKDGDLGRTPKKMDDVIAPGDVVMAEVIPATTGKSGQPTHLELRQVPKVEGALISLDPTTGRVLALSGGWSFAQSQFDRATQANRQPGSSFKPFVYLTALEQGISPSQQFLDGPITMDMGPGQPVWRPNNYEMTFNGPTPLRVALEDSLNAVTVRVALTVGLNAVAATAADFHVIDNMPKVPSAAIGAIETTVLRQAGAYASLDAGGKEVTPTLIDSVQDRQGHVISRPAGFDCANCSDPNAQPHIDDQRKQIADPQSVYQLIRMMEGVVQRGTGTLAAGTDLKDREIAGKTGTTEDFNDAWFGGFTPDLTTMVWVGFDNPASLGVNETGGSIAAPIWHDYMAAALKSRPNLQFRMPPGLTLADWDSGSSGDGNHGGSTIVADAFRPNQVPGASNDDLPIANATGLDQNGKPIATNPDGTPAETNTAAATTPPGAPPSGPSGTTPAGPTPPGTTPAAPGAVPAPPANPSSIDKSLGNLY